MNAPGLKPCPFCGAVLTNVQTADDGSGDIVWAEHPDKRGCWMDGYEFDWSAEGAYKPWNTRSPPSLLAGVPDGWVVWKLVRWSDERAWQASIEHTATGRNHHGTGPTPEAAVQDAASKVTPAADKEGGS